MSNGETERLALRLLGILGLMLAVSCSAALLLGKPVPCELSSLMCSIAGYLAGVLRGAVNGKPHRRHGPPDE